MLETRSIGVGIAEQPRLNWEPVLPAIPRLVINPQPAVSSMTPLGNIRLQSILFLPEQWDGNTSTTKQVSKSYLKNLNLSIAPGVHWPLSADKIVLGLYPKAKNNLFLVKTSSICDKIVLVLLLTISKRFKNVARAILRKKDESIRSLHIIAKLCYN